MDQKLSEGGNFAKRGQRSFKIGTPPPMAWILPSAMSASVVAGLKNGIPSRGARLVTTSYEQMHPADGCMDGPNRIKKP
jgi:hypothetical protein